MIVYDIETFPNVFTLHMECLDDDRQSTWEISQYRDDREHLLRWFGYLAAYQIPMIGFNNINFDYPVIHAIYKNPRITVDQIYRKAMSIIESQDKFGHLIWDRDFFTPQIDLFKIHHFDNPAKTTSLKALQINMKSETVEDSPVEFGTHCTREQIEHGVIPYNKHDVKKTKQFAKISLPAIEFRKKLIPVFGREVLNYNDTKIGGKMLEQRLGDDVCYDFSSGRKQRRQTVRNRIALNDIIFPYIQFKNPEFQRVLDFMRSQVLTPDDIEDPQATIKTKGVFTDLRAQVGGIEFHFGTGGAHASVESKAFVATSEWLIRDIDVEGLYPNIAIVNKLSPAHLGEVFVQAYASIPKERKLHKKGTPENAMFKLAANGVYGNSNNKFSVFYDPQFTMTITINGQLMICMLAEELCEIPTVNLIQCNTDGITYMVHISYLAAAKAVEAAWMEQTRLKLEDVQYTKMNIRDVNNYVAVDVNGKRKLKGTFWYPDPDDYYNSISNTAPPSWHKDFNPAIVARAAVAEMIDDMPVEATIYMATDPFEFICRARGNKGSQLYLGDTRCQNTLRYYVALQGYQLTKVSPPPEGCEVGQFKKANGVSKIEYERVMRETGGEWDERVCNKKKSRHEIRRTAVEAGWNVAQCNRASDFDFKNVNYQWYINEARKLVVK
jgi:hypothetical protein